MMKSFFFINNKQKNLFYYLLPLLLAFASGLIYAKWPTSFLAKGVENLSSLISEVFIKLFKFISLPVICLSVIMSLSNYSNNLAMKKMLRKTLFYTFSTTLLASFISLIIYLIIAPSPSYDGMVNADAINLNKKSYLDYVLNIIPSSIFSPFWEYQVMGVLFLGILIGIGIRYIPDKEAKESILNFFKGSHHLFLILTKWVIFLIPIALYGFISSTIVELNKEKIEFSQIGKYLTIIVLSNLVQGIVILPIILKLNKINAFKTLKGALPALSMAFFSKSSSGTLPISINTAEQKLGINPKVSQFVLPLCTTINMNGCAAFIFTTVTYVMQMQEAAEVNLATMILWIFISTLAAIGNAGVPMGCFFMSFSLLSTMGIPTHFLWIILPFYSIIDMVETSLNVWSDLCVTKLVDKKINFHLER